MFFFVSLHFFFNRHDDFFFSTQADGNCAIDAKATWWKGYSRLGAALQKNGEWDDAETTYKLGLKQVPDSSGKAKLNAELLACQGRRPGGTTKPKSNVNMWVTVQSYLRWFIVFNTLVHCVPFVNIAGFGYRNVLLGCLFKYCLTISYHGKPSMTAEYGIKVVKDLSMHYLFLTFIMLMVGKPNILVLFPLVTPDIYLLAGEFAVTSPALASTLSSPMKYVAKKMYGTDNYSMLSTQILAFNCMAEIGLGMTSIFELLTPQRNVIATVILWQFLRTRYMLMDDMKAAFSKLNSSLTYYIGTVPVIGSLWKLVQKLCNYMSAMPEAPTPGSAPKGMMAKLASKCTIM